MPSKETIFHKIISREIPADIIFENERFVVFRDIQPAAPSHLLIVPKKSIATLNDVQQEDLALLGEMLLIARQLAASAGIAESGYRVVINVGEAAGQSVFQLHMHLLGGRPFNWPPG